MPISRNNRNVGHRFATVGDAVIEPQHVARMMVSDAGLLRSSAGRAVVPVINMVDDADKERLAREAARL